jgi:thymidylate kinase
MSSLGRLIVLEGPDGVGKTTLAEMLRARLDEQGVPAQYLSFPGRELGTLGELVYRLHHDPAGVVGGEVSPTALQALHVAAHLDAIEQRILPILQAGKSVVLDRYWWSTWVYGAVGGVPLRVLDAMIALEREGWASIKPAVVVLVTRDRPWREEVTPAHWRSLVDAYEQLATKESKLYPVEHVANDQAVETVVESLMAAVWHRVGGKRKQGPAPFEGEPRWEPRQEPASGTQLPLDLPLPSLGMRGRRRGRASSFAPAVPTPVFDTYWRFATERQAIFFRRLEGQAPPWTTDSILSRHKFTNVYRASDRVSQYLIREVIYRGDQDPDEVFLRVLLFKLFNRIETWELLQRALGTIAVANFSPEGYSTILAGAMARGDRIYSAAYIMPAADRASPRKHVGHLMLLDRMLRDDVPHRLRDARSLRQAFELMRSYRMMGDFLAYQYVIDLNYSTLLDFSEMEFVVPGPGARSGIRKCFSESGGLSEADLIRLVAVRQEQEFAGRGLRFQSLYGRPLQLVDCQSLFCEVDKYARVAHPDVKVGSGRARIKQVFRGHEVLPAPWYPPKWGLNDKTERVQEIAHALI